MIWLLMFVGAALGAVLGAIYLINSIAKFSFIKNRLISFILVLGIFLFFFFTMGWINALTISIFTTIFFVLTGRF
ncbi:hypothetical protein SAMN02910384_02585 [Pseudobutyrivibrio sp. ACV-2]|uniref:hypothetical protein n=1 Tax=Pseudobutyrivibrio sp. ACV-2 TaxID=1520801 RepID=UPI0008987D02|nr:hypothetical protein [Pseudobutyrivibrio sp. ACV-2]SEA87626.1 hypothetical protein SAMN02910384_02585 [Pseudobutyrivibrio sp. ACV-2]